MGGLTCEGQDGRLLTGTGRDRGPEDWGNTPRRGGPDFSTLPLGGVRCLFSTVQPAPMLTGILHQQIQ